MRQRLIFILKHNSIIQRIYRVIMSFIFRVWGAFLPIDEGLVLFVSFMGMGFNDSPKVIYDYMQGHAELKDYRCVWAFEHPEKYQELETVRIDSFQYFKTALKAKHWVTNTNIERGLHFKKKNQVYLNTWHGVPLKHAGNDCPGRKDFDFSNVDFFCVSGKYDEHIYKKGLNVREESCLRYGLPRNEVLWKVTEKEKQEMRKCLGIPDDKKVILYAPTWRDSTNGGKSYEIKPPIHFDVWKNKLGKEYVVFFRAHHQTTKVLGVQYDEFVKDASEYSDVNDLMIAADILITDYSAIAFDFCILCRPILCYVYDYESYIGDRGTYFSIDDKYPNKSCRTEEELLERIQGIDYEMECQNTRRFREEFMQYGSEATEACVRAFIAKKGELK